mmetsp:Transcript_2848/g.9374  ORF Transcript_2848/g.9374 Transcript_2848/m.9374 type:complete len:211 (+) Transcript_2848:1191-1823(+)
MRNPPPRHRHRLGPPRRARGPVDKRGPSELTRRRRQPRRDLTRGEEGRQRQSRQVDHERRGCLRSSREALWRRRRRLLLVGVDGVSGADEDGAALHTRELVAAQRRKGREDAGSEAAHAQPEVRHHQQQRGREQHPHSSARRQVDAAARQRVAERPGGATEVCVRDVGAAVVERGGARAAARVLQHHLGHGAQVQRADCRHRLLPLSSGD